jgi:hypothetical protein
MRSWRNEYRIRVPGRIAVQSGHTDFEPAGQLIPLQRLTGIRALQ